MRQMVQQDSLSQHNLSKTQIHLIKYCYANSTTIQEETRTLIAICDKPQILEKFDYILTCYIMPYFFINRTLFDRIRNDFVRFMHLCLTNQSSAGLSPYSFLCNYRSICANACISDDLSTRDLYNQLVKKVESEIPRLI